MLPIMRVNGLNKFPKVSKGGWFLMMDHFIFDLFCKTIICLPKECSFAPLDMCCKLGKPDEVFSSLVVPLHMESFKLGLGFTHGVVGTKVQFEFLDEKSEVR